MIIKFFQKLFTKRNLIKLIIIFTVGLVSRYLVNTYFNINVFSEFLHPISIIYYLSMSTFIVFVHELLDFSSLPSLSFLLPKINNFVFNNLNKVSFKGFTLLDLVYSIKSFINFIMFGDRDYLNVDKDIISKNVNIKVAEVNDKDSLINNKGNKGKGKLVDTGNYHSQSSIESQSDYENYPDSPDSSKNGLRRSHKIYSLSDIYKYQDNDPQSSDNNKQISNRVSPSEQWNNFAHFDNYSRSIPNVNEVNKSNLTNVMFSPSALGIHIEHTPSPAKLVEGNNY